LPEDLFDIKGGDVRPSKPVKRIIKTANSDNKLRRNINEVEVLCFDLPCGNCTDLNSRAPKTVAKHLPSDSDS
jgi:hypothetical protein